MMCVVVFLSSIFFSQGQKAFPFSYLTRVSFFCFRQNLIRQSTDLSEDEVRKSIGGVGDFLRMEGKDEGPAARDTVGT